MLTEQLNGRSYSKFILCFETTRTGGLKNRRKASNKMLHYV